MPSQKTCPECGAKLPADSPHGLCPKCLFLGGVSTPAYQADPAAEIGSESGATFCSSVGSEKVGDRIGRYKLLQKLGEGGCGTVYMAEQEEPVRRKVALKVIKLGMDTKQVVARFEAERQALAMMDHPNIAKVLDAGSTETGRPYFVMELVRGRKITQYCDEARLSTRLRLDLFVEVCQAVQHAHQKGIIHRDLKPSNILVTERDGVPVPKVIDFGIAKATSDIRLTDKTVFTAFEQFIGTPAYMSPEQARLGELDIDTRSDIYSLGVLLYELLTGKTPFDTKALIASGLDEMRRTICEKEPAKPSTRLGSESRSELTTTAELRRTEPVKLVHLVKGDLDWIVMKTLEKDRARRYETANGLAMDIKRHLSSQPVVARPPSRLYEFQKMVRRHKPVFIAAGGIAAALIIGLGTFWMFFQEREAKEQAVYSKLKESRQREIAQNERAVARRLLYKADMNLAQEAWEQNNIGSLRELLKETQTSPDRGFEWYFWQRQCHLCSKTLRGHAGAVTSVAVSKDGGRIVTGSADRTARVWDAATGREMLRFERHSARITSVAFSPDGQRVVTGSRDKTARVWDATTGQELAILTGHSNEVLAVAFLPDGRRIVTGGGDNAARVWDTASGRELLSFREHTGPISCVGVSPDGQRIVTGSDDKSAMVWDATTGRRLLPLTGHNGWVRAVAFSPDGRRLATGSADKMVIAWDAFSGQKLSLLPGHTDQIGSVAFSKDGQRILTSSRDQTAKVWEMSSCQELLTLKGHSGWVRSAAFSPDGQWIVTGSQDKTAMVWEANPDRELLTLKGHTSGIGSVAFSRDGERVVTGSVDQTAKIWEVSTGRELRTLTNHIVVNGERGDPRTLAVAFSPDGLRIVTGGEDQAAKVWEASSGRELLTLPGHKSWIGSVTFSPDGSRIVTGGGENAARVWDSTNGRKLLTLEGHEARIWSVAYSPDGQRIVTGSGDMTAVVWDSTNGRKLLTLEGHEARIWSVAYSPDGQRIVTGSGDMTAKVWDAATGLELRPLQLKGHAGQVRSVAFSPDGRRIVTTSEDQTAKVWDAVSGRDLLTLKGHNSHVRSVAFSPDGLRIVTGSQDQTAKVWSAARAEEVNAWLEEEGPH